MNSKIDGVSGGTPPIDSARRTDEARRGGQPSTPQSGSDQVSLTETGRLMVSLEKIIESVPDVDRDRVDAIKQAITDGTYSIDAEKVAAEVLRMEADLSRRK